MNSFIGNSFTGVFLAALAAMLAVQAWLAIRQVRHVRAHRRAVPAPFRRRIPLAAHRKAADYTVARTRFALADGVLGAALLVGWTLGGGADWLDQFWRARGWGELTTGTVFLLSAFLIMGLLDLPASIYQTFVLENRYGFNRTTPGLFVTDLAKQALLLALLGAPLAAAALWLMGAGGAHWWLYLWLLWTAFSLFLVWAYPTLIAPLFNRFSPLKSGALKKRIQALLRRTGFVSRGIFVMDGSRRSAHGNAYFTGLGRSKRIVFFDTLLKTLGAREIEAVLAHELGHFKRRHVLKRLVLSFALSLAALALLGWLAQAPWFYHGLGVTQPSAHAALLLFMLAGPVFSFFLRPLLNWGSRRDEYQADAFAAEQAEARALVSALAKLYKENAATLTPDPVHSAFYDSHPPALARIRRLETPA
jgi:STE24 endopeptidase